MVILPLAPPSLFPLLDLLPRALVDRVVNRHYSLHIRVLGVIRLALHRIEKHLLRGIYPVPRLLVRARIPLIVRGPHRRRR